MTTDNHVRIFDTTLRDGEQSPGATMTLDEKLRIARNLEALGVDVIEAGFPAASAGELQSVREIAAVVSECEVAGLCRTREPDIEASWKAVSAAKKPRLHVFIATSKLHMEHKLKLSPAQVLEEVRRGVKHCASLTKSVEFSAEDATRTELPFLKEVFACAIENGATVLNIPDTVGYTMPTEYSRIVSEVMGVVGDRDVIVSTHCHNDLGLASRTHWPRSWPARERAGCVNGIRERAVTPRSKSVWRCACGETDRLRHGSTRARSTTSASSSPAAGWRRGSKPIVGRTRCAQAASTSRSEAPHVRDHGAEHGVTLEDWLGKHSGAMRAPPPGDSLR